MPLKHNLKECIELINEEPAFVPLYLYEWKKELQQQKQERIDIIKKYPKDIVGKAASQAMIELIDEILGDSQT